MSAWYKTVNVRETAQGQRYRQAGITSIGLLVKPDQGDGTLKKPYEFEIPAAVARQLGKDLKDLLKPLNKRLQYAYLETKAVSKGQRIGLYMLGYKPGLYPEVGVTHGQWDTLCAALVKRITVTLGKRVDCYVEPWSPLRKFQFRFETYIKFTEL